MIKKHIKENPRTFPTPAEPPFSKSVLNDDRHVPALSKLNRYNEAPPGGWVWPHDTTIKAVAWKDLKRAVREKTGLSDEHIEHVVAESLPSDWRI